MLDFDLEFFLLVSTALTGGVVLVYRLRRSPHKKAGWLVSMSRSFFPVLLVVFVIRSFLFEPFRIPSGSMLPTLEVGDFIVVNKYVYGLRFPTFHWKFWENGKPARGDIAVFRYPHNEKQDYVKRVVGLPGDKIGYRNKKLYINNEVVSYEVIDENELIIFAGGGSQIVERKQENLPFSPHEIYIDPYKLPIRWNKVWQIPDDYYFVLGDNRDNSNDSRAWGLVPEENLVGRAFAVWMHLDFGGDGIDLSRIGTVLK